MRLIEVATGSFEHQDATCIVLLCLLIVIRRRFMVNSMTPLHFAGNLLTEWYLAPIIFCLSLDIDTVTAKKKL